MDNIPKRAGFYDEDGFPCAYADSKQVTDDLYALECDLIYRSKSGTIYVIKKGFEHDGASKAFLRHFGRYTNAAILHDALYGSEIESRWKADALFREAMEVSETEWGRRWTYWAAVRLAGWKVWYSHDRLGIAKARQYIERIEDE